jgi:hypothetical protein
MTSANANSPLPSTSRDPHASTTHPVLILIAWVIVGVPLLWGVSQTFMKSLDLFRPPPAQTGKGAPAPTLPNAAPQPTTTPTTPLLPAAKP